ncbi:ATP-binding protein [Bacillus sp. 31A1R]|uniref:ATP-binding protein n=1 Tax=Robertmurraya mangrovi TaxID=3098077 RepID=A0ABU5J5G8_9BACI|nr:ATP-binding protein [Bacillus sp. 31A1R]MDZ5474592.1 ATP-binding protein [Bacillus sp. 31A1R]
MKICIHELTKSNLSVSIERVLETIDYLKSNLCSDTLRFNIKLALWEIFTNYIVHGNEHSCREIVVLKLENDREIEITIISEGSDFDSEHLIGDLCPSVEQIGGRGLYIVQQICDMFLVEQRGKIAKMVFKKD